MTFGELIGAFVLMMRASGPFEDVLTPVYERLLIGDKGQFMTSPSLASGVVKLLEPSPSHLAEPTCGTGSLALANLRSILADHGPLGVASSTMILNDFDGRLLNIAALHVIFESIHHAIPLARMAATCSNLITEYDTNQKPVFEAVGVCVERDDAAS